MTRWWIACVLAWLAIVVGRSAAQGSETVVSAELSHGSVYVGDQVTYQVIVRGERPVGRPSVAFPSSVRAQDAGSSESSRQYMQIINGRRERIQESSVAFQYRLQVVEPGPVTVPPATVTMPDGRQLRTESVSMDVLLPRLASGFDLRIEPERTNVYLGESVTALVVWEVDEPSGISRINFDSSSFDPSLEVEPAPPPASQGLQEFSFLGQRAVASLEEVFSGGGGQRISFSFRVRITPTRAGSFDVGPLRVVFDRARLGRGSERVYSESDTITLDVRPVPAEGRPEGYSGLIGSYELRTLASPTTVNVGDPITLRAELRGREPMGETVALPELSGIDGFSRFRLSSEGWREELPRENGRRVFGTTIRALSDEVSQIPPVVIHTFDPVSGRFERVASAPIQIEVRAVREATLADALMSPGAGNGQSGARSVIGPGEPTFWAAPSPAAVLNARPFDPWEAVRNPGVVAVVASGPGAVLVSGAFVLAARRRARPAVARDRALKRAEHTAVRSGPAAGARAAAAAVLGCEVEAVTATDLRRLPVHPGLIRTLIEALEPAEAPGERDPAGADAADTRLAIRSVRRAMRRAPLIERGGGS